MPYHEMNRTLRIRRRGQLLLTRSQPLHFCHGLNDDNRGCTSAPGKSGYCPLHWRQRAWVSDAAELITGDVWRAHYDARKCMGMAQTQQSCNQAVGVRVFCALHVGQIPVGQVGRATEAETHERGVIRMRARELQCILAGVPFDEGEPEMIAVRGTREPDLVQREADLAQREADLAQREADLAQREAALAVEEAELMWREQELLEREQDLEESEDRLSVTVTVEIEGEALAMGAPAPGQEPQQAAPSPTILQRLWRCFAGGILEEDATAAITTNEGAGTVAAAAARLTDVDEGERFECSICRETMNDPVRTSCGHTYCHACINQWRSGGGPCPICRSAIRQTPQRDRALAFAIAAWQARDVLSIV